MTSEQRLTIKVILSSAREMEYDMSKLIDDGLRANTTDGEYGSFCRALARLRGATCDLAETLRGRCVPNGE